MDIVLKRNFGVKSKLLLSLFAFSIIILVILWVLQILCLDSIYRGIKVHTIRRYSDKITSLDDSAYDIFLLNAATDEQLCINIYDENLNLLAGEHAGGRCVVHNIGKSSVNLFFNAALSFDEKSFESYLPADDIARLLERNDFFHSFVSDFFGERKQSFSSVTSDNESDCMLVCRVFQNEDGEERFLLMSSVIIPVNATKNVIGFELLLVSAVLVILSVVVAYFLSKTITRPIVQLNSASKRLAEGEFSSDGIGGYREVEELSNTLSEAAFEIRQVEKLRRELVANVSHDLRTPLTLIAGYSEAMRDLPGENTAENLQIVIDETTRLSQLVTDLLDLSKLEAGMDRLQREEVEVVSFTRDILKRYDKMIAQHGYTIKLESNCDQIRVFVDSLKFGQVVYNLVNNAIHYCGEDKMVIVRLSADDKKLLFEVEDHGQGIPRDKLREIWDRYYRVDSNHESHRVGTGLGLSIVKKVLQLHNAAFGVRSEEGNGSCFWFVLPLLDQ